MTKSKEKKKPVAPRRNPPRKARGIKERREKLRKKIADAVQDRREKYEWWTNQLDMLQREHFEESVFQSALVMAKQELGWRDHAITKMNLEYDGFAVVNLYK